MNQNIYAINNPAKQAVFKKSSEPTLLRWINGRTTARHVEKARWVAIAHPMALGDVVAALPLAGIIRAAWPHLKFCFIGSSYARPLIDCCENIDHFLDFRDVLANPGVLVEQGIDIFINPFPHHDLAVAACRAGVPVRVGNLRRWKTARCCNRFVIYSRRNSGRHEIELNLENLAGLGLPTTHNVADIPGYFGLTRVPELDDEWNSCVDSRKFNMIFHPKSNKNGREWPAGHYLSLAQSLPQDRFRIIVTGLPHERDILLQEMPEIFHLPHVTDMCGKLSLSQFIALIGRIDGIVASGTGPLHLAAAMHKHAMGIFPPRPDIDPAHWAPVGWKAEFLCLDEQCLPGGNSCPKDFSGGACACTEAILPEQVLARVLTWRR